MDTSFLTAVLDELINHMTGICVTKCSFHISLIYVTGNR
jgi:hypothetical protein